MALGQQGNLDACGSGGSFCVLDGDEGPEPLLVAAGAGCADYDDEEFGRGNINKTAVGNEKIGKSGIQKILPGDKNDIYCGGAGYSEAPQVFNLAKECVPATFSQGLTGGKGVSLTGEVTEGGFGGGGGCYVRNVNGEDKCYYGAGGGFTGGSTKVHNGKLEDEDGKYEECHGGGGGSFSADPDAKFEHYYVQDGYCKIKRRAFNQ